MAVASLWVFNPLARSVEPADLVVPQGYTIQKIVSAPDVRFPMFGAFDERGRLFVAESSGLDLYAELQKLSQTCRITQLEDRDGDGRFESSHVFADGLVFPMGLAWHDGRLYVADPPKVVALEDTDGDGRADKRTVILGDFGHSDNGSLHGLIFGPDGWLYMTLGEPDGYELARPDGTILSGKSGALLRCRPDGSNIEVICRGFENLVEIDFMPTGEILGTDNWFYLPAAGVRDALVHLLEGALYPRFVRDLGTPMLVSGEPLPCISAYPAVAFSGMTRYRGSAFPSNTWGDFFSAQHNTRKVMQHHFERSSATFQSTDSDFVTTQDPDFHPSDVLEDADGSLLVIDTGSWYVHHCPTGRIRHVPAPGGIFRVRHSKGTVVSDPRGLSLNWGSVPVAELVTRLSDGREAVRARAAEQLTIKGSEAIPLLQRLLIPATPLPTVEKAVWVLARIPDGSAALIGLLHSDSSDVVALAARALGRTGTSSAAAELIRLLKSPAAHVGLAAAEALAHCGSPAAVPSVFEALSRADDRFLQHSLINVLYKWAGRDELLRALNSENPQVERAALVLLDQFPHNALPAEAAVSRLFATNIELREAARSAVAKHTDWVSQALPALRKVAYAAGPDARDLAMLNELALAFRANSSVVQFVAEALEDTDHVGTPTRLGLIETLSHLPGTQIPDAWAKALQRLLHSPSPEIKQQALRTARALQLPALDESLAQLARNSGEPAGIRVQALSAVIRRHPSLSESEFQLVLEQLNPANAANLRLEASEILSQSRLSGVELSAFLARVKEDPIISPTLFVAAAQHSPEPSTIALELLRYLQKGIEAGGTLSSRHHHVAGGDHARRRSTRFPEIAAVAQPEGRAAARPIDGAGAAPGGWRSQSWPRTVSGEGNLLRPAIV